jgi:hypothetical protein
MISSQKLCPLDLEAGQMFNIKLEKYIETNMERMEGEKQEGRTERNKQHKKSRWCLIISVKMNKYMYHQKWCVGRITNCPYTQLVGLLQFYAKSKCDESKTRRRNFGRSAVLSYLWFRNAGSLGYYII